MSGMNAVLQPFSIANAQVPRVQIRAPPAPQVAAVPHLVAMVKGVFAQRDGKFPGYELVLSAEECNAQVLRAAEHFKDVPAPSDPTSPFSVTSDGIYKLKVNVKDLTPMPEFNQSITATIEYHWYTMPSEKGTRCGSYAKLICFSA